MTDLNQTCFHLLLSLLCIGRENEQWLSARLFFIPRRDLETPRFYQKYILLQSEFYLFEINLGSKFNAHFNHFEVTTLNCQMKWTAFSIIGKIDVGFSRVTQFFTWEMKMDFFLSENELTEDRKAFKTSILTVQQYSPLSKYEPVTSII